MVLNQEKIIQLLRERIPNLLAIYAFGSQIDGTARADSDLDLAVLIAGKGDAVQLFNLSNEIARLIGVDSVDLLDLRTVGTLMQKQVITTGEQWWALNHQAGIYEVIIIKKYHEWHYRNAGLLNDIMENGWASRVR